MGNTHDAEVARIEADYIKTRWRTTDDYRWGYTKARGPETWWIYYPSASGGCQSPIDIVMEDAYADDQDQMNSGGGGVGGGGGGGEYCPGRLEVCYLSSASLLDQLEEDEEEESIGETRALVNTGNSVRISVKNPSSYISGGPCRDFRFLLHHVELHWGDNDFWGSEHSVNGHPFAAELHFVHWNSDLYEDYEEAMKRDGAIVIIAVFAKLSNGKSNKCLEKMSLQTEDIAYRGQSVLGNDLDINCLLPDFVDRFWSYRGSFTTPPCYETVTWIVLEQPISITTQQLERFRQLRCYCENEERPSEENEGRVTRNVRNPQPIGTRKVMTFSAITDDVITIRPITNDQEFDPQLSSGSSLSNFNNQRRDQLYQWQQ